jgi:pimeloyl-ACP methyl ester carboxylesterase
MQELPDFELKPVTVATSLSPHDTTGAAQLNGGNMPFESANRGTVMPFADNQGVRIHCQTVGNGPALVLHHGTLGSGADWANLGYADAMKEDHRLILLDSRGHGESDKPHDPAA